MASTGLTEQLLCIALLSPLPFVFCRRKKGKQNAPSHGAQRHTARAAFVFVFVLFDGGLTTTRKGKTSSWVSTHHTHPHSYTHSRDSLTSHPPTSWLSVFWLVILEEQGLCDGVMDGGNNINTDTETGGKEQQQQQQHTTNNNNSAQNLPAFSLRLLATSPSKNPQSSPMHIVVL